VDDVDGGNGRQGASEEPLDAGAVRERVARSVRELRARSGRSLADLASSAGIGKSTLHAIEAGEANPGIETLWALATALGVPFGALLETPTPSVRVVRAGQAPRVSSESGTVEARLLTTTAHGARTELYTIGIEPGEGRPMEPHAAGTIEHVLVTHGRLQVGPVGAEVTIETGDLASFPADVLHRYDAREPDTRVVLVIEYT
jgi:transcriptional regulator with XRE-family HTH domain